VVELLHWSFVMALTCLALDLAWRLVSMVGNWIGGGLSRPAEDHNPWGPRDTRYLHRTSSYGAVRGRVSSVETVRPHLPRRRTLLGESGGLSIS
jgi:hypothetical protein